MTTDNDIREQRIKQMMRYSGMSREEAESEVEIEFKEMAEELARKKSESENN